MIVVYCFLELCDDTCCRRDGVVSGRGCGGFGDAVSGVNVLVVKCDDSGPLSFLGAYCGDCFANTVKFVGMVWYEVFGSAPVGVVVKSGERRSNAKQEGRVEVGRVKIMTEVLHEWFTNVVKSGAIPNYVGDVCKVLPAVLTRVSSVVTTGFGMSSIPSGTLLYQPEQAELVRRRRLRHGHMWR